MSARLVAPSRSPLRRCATEMRSPIKKYCKSPVRAIVEGNQGPVRARKVDAVGFYDPDAEALRIQADECEELRHELTHLAPCFQRFWKRADTFSPRSQRLSRVVPKPRSEEETAKTKLAYVIDSVACEMERGRKVQEATASCLKQHFESIPSQQLSETIKRVFASFDVNDDGHLDEVELKTAFASMGKMLTDEELELIMEEYDTNHDKIFQLDEFENMIRCSLHLPLAPVPPA
eukprot:CAMPEP_0113711878 /NCGR_PEP_ID=MMETSP0038_2-20120614/31038_1 /TAXON_ID=2898 /ORGANISM="Cryptomonas paramecium" /LENGTH=232 /DNA_ID=CAMNT_0000638257 /DNA_START=27 /DNA_END=721 /DNA_ORIENTATION=- /assembly_acc=CAM_ASM_000170